MVRLRFLAWGPALAVAVVVGSCGGPSDAEQRDKRATYVRAADKICDGALDKVRAGDSPRSYPALERRMKRDAKTLRGQAAELHGLHEKLGDAASDEIDAFDAHLDAVVSVTRRIGDDAELYDAGAARRSSGRLRDAYDALYRAGQKAKLRRCGRGGNRAADLPLFTVYRDQYSSANVETILRLGRERSVQDFAAYRQRIRRTVHTLSSYRKRLVRLAPPMTLERSNRLLTRRVRLMVNAAKRLLKLLNRGPAAALNGGAELALSRFVRQADLASVAARKIDRALDLGRGGGSGLGPGDTDAA